MPHKIITRSQTSRHTVAKSSSGKRNRRRGTKYGGDNTTPDNIQVLIPRTEFLKRAQVEAPAPKDQSADEEERLKREKELKERLEREQKAVTGDALPVSALEDPSEAVEPLTLDESVQLRVDLEDIKSNLKACSDFVVAVKTQSPLRKKDLKESAIEPVTLAKLRTAQELTPSLLQQASDWNKIKANLTASQERTGRMSEAIEETRKIVDELKETLKNMRRAREKIEYFLGLIRHLIYSKAPVLGQTPEMVIFLEQIQRDTEADWALIIAAKNFKVVSEIEQGPHSGEKSSVGKHWIVNLIEQAVRDPEVGKIYQWKDPENGLPLGTPNLWFKYLELADYRLRIEYYWITRTFETVAPPIISAAQQQAEIAEHFQNQQRLQQIQEQLKNALAPYSNSSYPNPAPEIGVGERNFENAVTTLVKQLTTNLARLDLSNVLSTNAVHIKYYESEWSVYKDRLFTFRRYVVSPVEVYKRHLEFYAKRYAPPRFAPFDITTKEEDKLKFNTAYLQRVETLVLLEILQNALAQMIPQPAGFTGLAQYIPPQPVYVSQPQQQPFGSLPPLPQPGMTYPVSLQGSMRIGGGADRNRRSGHKRTSGKNYKHHLQPAVIASRRASLRSSKRKSTTSHK